MKLYIKCILWSRRSRPIGQHVHNILDLIFLSLPNQSDLPDQLINNL